MKKVITFILIGIASICNAQNEQILAGSTDPGYSEGITGSYANFNTPFNIATDLNGYLYVADTYNNSIRKISPNGNLVITILSSGFYKPAGIVVDQSGNIYVADTGNHCIKKITSLGVVSTFAGSSQGYANGIGTSAKFDSPYGLTIDSSGNIYVADSAFDNTDQSKFGSIRKITPSGLVSTFYSPPPPTGFSFRPTGVAIDALGNLYVANSNSNMVSKISSSGQLISSINANATPWGIALDSMGNIYLTIKTYPNPSSNLSNPIIYGFNNSSGISTEIRKITPNGYVTIELSAGLSMPFGITINNNNEIFIADSTNNRIAKLSTGSVLNNFAGVNYSILGSYNYCLVSGIYDGLGEISKAHFNYPNGLGKDSNGNIYVADTQNHRIRKITPSGVVSTLVGSVAGFNNGNANQALLHYPHGIFVDLSNNIYTLTRSAPAGMPDQDLSLMNIRKISPTGDVSSFPISNPNLIISAQTAQSGIVVDQNGNVYVPSYNLIQKITPNGVVSTFAGDWSSGYINGIGIAARFNKPKGLCIDSSGNIYVADSGNNRIRKITPNGLVTTLAANSSIVFNSPNGVAINGGVIYLSEGSDFSMCSTTIKKITTNEEVYTVCQNCGGGGSITFGPNCIYVIKGNQINIVTDQALETNQNSFTNNQIHLFPNPAKDQLTIDLSSNLNLIGGNYKMLNMLGQEVQNGQLYSQQNTLDLINIKEQGIYLVKIYDNSKNLIETKKIIIQQ